MRWLFLEASLCLALSVAPVNAEPAISAMLSTNTIHVGDRVELVVSMTHDMNERLIIPPINREPYIVVWDSRSEYKNAPDEKRISTTRITLSSFVIGEHRVATNPILYLMADGREQAIPFPVLLLNVSSVLTNPPPALADIKPPVSLPGRLWLCILLILIAILALTAIAAWLITIWLRRPPAPAQMQLIPPDEIAMKALNALIDRGLIEKGDTEPFYIELSDIVRLYLEQRFDLHAPEQTTEEFIRTSSQSNQLSAEHRSLTQTFLEQSDLVKFARFQPSTDDMKSAWNAAVSLVRDTKPTPARTSGGSV